MPTATRILALLILTLALGGCALTKNRYEKGVKREADGRYEEAFDYYWKVVNKDPGYADAAVRLEDLGAQLIETFWAEAQELDAAGRYEAAVRRLDRLESIAQRAAAVEIRLGVPEGLAAFRETMENAALRQWIDRGRQAEQRGDWPAAMDAYDRALSYPVSAEQRHDLDLARASVLLHWGEDDLAAGRARAAFERAGQAIDLLPPQAADLRPLRALQDEAVRIGTRLAAFVPFSESDAVREIAPRGFVEEVNDVLVVDFWTQPPLFLAPVDPIELRRYLRRVDAPRDRLSDRQAARLGRDLGADFVVVGELTALTYTEKDKRERVREAKTRGRAVTDTTYTIERYDLEIEAEISFVLVDPASRRPLYRGTRSAAVEDRFERGVYAGDMNRLILDRDELRYFDEQALREKERALEEDLIDQLAARVAEEVFDQLIKQIP